MRSLVGVVSIAVWIAALLINIFDPTPTTRVWLVWDYLGETLVWIYQIAALVVFIGMVSDNRLSYITLPNKLVVGSWVVFLIVALVAIAFNPGTAGAATPAIITCIFLYILFGYLIIALVDWAHKVDAFRDL